MPKQPPKNDWIDSKPVLLGPFVRIPRGEIVEILGLAGFDFAVADMEHGPITVSELYPMILAAERRGIRLIVRIPELRESYFKWLLDLGVHGIQVPHIKTAADARAAVSFSKFSPQGERGLCRFVRAAEFSNIPKDEYLSRANGKSVLILMVEGKEGVANVGEILEVPGIDVLFVGPYDLSQSLGLIGQIWHPKVVAEIKKVIAACAGAGVAVGVFTDTPEGVARWAALGVKYINYRIEVELLLSSAKDEVQALRRRPQLRAGRAGRRA
jgi:4-hydroxy-2-oxoheptanedioate aldolase